MLETISGSRLDFATKGMPKQLQEGIMQLLPPKNLLLAYQNGRATHRTNDIVLVVSSEEPGLITPFPRFEYVRGALKNDAARRAHIANESAHQVAKLPTSSSAFWLVLEVRGYPAPVMCVLYETFYETGDHVEAPSIGAN